MLRAVSIENHELRGVSVNVASGARCRPPVLLPGLAQNFWAKPALPRALAALKRQGPDSSIVRC